MKVTMVKFAALAMCAILLGGVLCGCDKEPVTDDTAATTTTATIVALPTYVRVDATGSVFIGTWTVDSHGGTVTELTFEESGSVIVTMGDVQLGGGFIVDGDTQITLNVASSPKTFNYTVEGDVITLENDKETWTLTKTA